MFEVTIVSLQTSSSRIEKSADPPIISSASISSVGPVVVVSTRSCVSIGSEVTLVLPILNVLELRFSGGSLQNLERAFRFLLDGDIGHDLQLSCDQWMNVSPPANQETGCIQAGLVSIRLSVRSDLRLGVHSHQRVSLLNLEEFFLLVQDS